MPAPDHARLTIDFDLWADPIAGVVHDDSGHGEPFAGWMALTRTIERTLDAARRVGQDIPADAPSAPGPDSEPPGHGLPDFP
jgi:hypothetical protein